MRSGGCAFGGYLYVNGSGSITTVGEERELMCLLFLLVIMWFLLERFPIPLQA